MHIHLLKTCFGSLLLLAMLKSSPAFAAVYMADDGADEIKLTNLINDHELANENSHYVALIEDEPVTASIQRPKPIDLRAPIGETYTQQHFAGAIAEAAKVTAIEPALLHAVIRVESNYNPHAISPKGARGLMQLMPDTARRFQVKNANDPTQNILAGARYLRELHSQFKGDLALVLAAYNAGPNAIIKSGLKVPPYPETRQYVPKVLAIYQHLLANQAASSPL